MINENNLTMFTTKVRRTAGNSKGIHLPPDVLSFENLKVGDFVTVYVRKLLGDHGEGD